MTKYTPSNGSFMLSQKSGNRLVMFQDFYLADEVDMRIAQLEAKLQEAEAELGQYEIETFPNVDPTTQYRYYAKGD